jgi:AmmeMemoRadiSam system protein A
MPFTEDNSANIRALDMGAWELIQDLDGPGFRQYCEQTGATICGRNPLSVLLDMLPPEDTLTLLAYDQSGQMTDDFDNSVSYLAAAASGTWAPKADGRLIRAEQDALLQFARHTLEYYYREGRQPQPAEVNLDPTPAMQEKRGAFVTLRHAGALRGCIGDLSGHGPLYQAVMENALNAALRDSRFVPVDRDELDDLDIEISALTPLRPVDSYLDFQPGRQGIVLTKLGRRAVYLPQVATEQGWSREQTLASLSLKAGLPEDAWRSGARFEVFEAQVFGEHEE